MKTERKHILIDIPTLIVISFMAWVLVVAIYKLVEYVSAAILVDTPIQVISTAVITLDWNPVLRGLMPGFVSAGGLWANYRPGSSSPPPPSARSIGVAVASFEVGYNLDPFVPYLGVQFEHVWPENVPEVDDGDTDFLYLSGGVRGRVNDWLSLGAGVRAELVNQETNQIGGQLEFKARF